MEGNGRRKSTHKQTKTNLYGIQRKKIREITIAELELYPNKYRYVKCEMYIHHYQTLVFEVIRV